MRWIRAHDFELNFNVGVILDFEFIVTENSGISAVVHKQDFIKIVGEGEFELLLYQGRAVRDVVGFGESLALDHKR